MDIHYVYVSCQKNRHMLSEYVVLSLLEQLDTELFTHPSPIKVHISAYSGASRYVTNNKNILNAVYDINDYHMGTMGSGIKCKAHGLYHIKCDDDSIITVEIFYSPDASHTVILLTDIVTK